MGKAPAFQFYVKDWLSDTQLKMVSYTTKGIWIDVLCYMWLSPVRGEISGTPEKIRQMVGCDAAEIVQFLDDVFEYGFCDSNVTRNGKVTDRNGKITLRNRRMYNDEKLKTNGKIRQQRHRDKRKRNSKVTPPSPSPSSPSTPNTNKNFEIFYEKYPIKKGKQAAQKAWVKQKPNLDVCLKAIELQKDEKRKLKDAGEFCPEWKYPATWINQGCWDDEIIKTEAAAASEGERNFVTTEDLHAKWESEME